MNIRDIERLVQRMQDAQVAQCELVTDAGRLFVRVDLATPPPFLCDASAPATVQVCAPCTGVFRRIHPLAKQAAVQAGQQVLARQVLGFIVLDGALLGVPAPCGGLVRACPALDDAAVTAGEALFELQPDA